MHQPPAVQWCVVRSVVQACAISLGFLINSLVLFVLFGHTEGSAWWALAGACASLAMMALWGWLHSATGLLTWSGTQWWWLQSKPGSQPQICEIGSVMDFQTFVLVRLRDGEVFGSTRWLWIDCRTGNPSQWTALRRALVASFGVVRVTPVVT